MITQQQQNEYQVIANAILTISTMCAANPAKTIDLLTGYLFDEEEASDIKILLKQDNKK